MSLIVRKDFEKLSHPYQQSGVDFMYEHDSALLLLRMGAGKTIMALTAASELLDSSFIDSVLIVAPLAVCNNTWRTEYLGWSHTFDMDIGIATGSPAQRTAVLGGHQIVVINYENLQWLAKNWPDRAWDLIILDEATRFNNISSKRFQALWPYLRRAKIRWGLTASLGANHLHDVFNPVRCIDLGKSLGRTVGPFRAQYMWKTDYGYDAIPGAAAQVSARIAPLCYRPDPAVYEAQLPELVVTRHVYSMGVDGEKAYRELAADYLTAVSDVSVDVASAGVLVGKLQQCVSGFLYSPDDRTVLQIDRDRLGVMQELIASAEGEPVIVWYWYEATGDALRSLGYVELLDNLDAWNRGEIPVAIAHPAAAGHGINAQAGGARMIMLEHCWSAELRAQSLARLHRQGQKRTVYVHDLVAEIGGRPTIDKAILDAQGDKDAIAKAITQGL